MTVYTGEDIALDLYPKADPKNGPRIRRLTSLQTGSFVRREQKGTGVVTVVIPGDSDDAEAIDPTLGHYVKAERKGAVITLATSAAADDIVDTAAAHGLSVGHKLEFVTLTGGAGLSTTPAYYVESVPSSTSLKVAATKGGSAINFTTDITAGSTRRLTTVAGGFLLGGNYNALSKDGTKPLVLTGPGPLHYLSRGRVSPHSYLGDDPQPEGIQPLHKQGAWFGTDHYGSEFARVITEMTLTQADDPGDQPNSPHPNDNDRLVNALPALTITFDGFTDTNGVPWTGARGEFDVQVALEDGLRIAFRFMQAGLELDIDPDTFELRAYNTGTLGTDRTGSAWGAGVVRFQVPTDNKVGTSNVFTTAKRALAAFIQRSLVWAGREDVWGVARNASAPVLWEGGYSSEAANETALNTVAGVQVVARTDAGDVPRLKVWAGNDESTGRYIYGPGGHADIWDRGTVHSGTGTWDWNQWTAPLSALEWRIENPNGEFDTYVEFGSTFRGLDEVMRFAGGAIGAHGPHIRLCVPGTLAIPPVRDHGVGAVGGGSAAITWDGSGTTDLTIPSTDADRALYAFALHRSDLADPTVAWGVGPQTFAKIGSVDAPGGIGAISVYRLLNPTPGTGTVGPSATATRIGGFYLVNVDQSVPNGPLVSATEEAISTLLGIGGLAAQPLDAAGWMFFNSPSVDVPSPGASQTQAWAVAFDSVPGTDDHEFGGSYGGANPSWASDSARNWVHVGLAVNGSGGTAGDGHPDLVDGGSRASRCGHRHDVHRASAPTVNDDASQGYKLGTIWAQLDSLTTPTEIIGVWILVDDTEGAAVWLELPGGMTEAEVEALIAGHVAATDPHPDYLTQAEHDALSHTAVLPLTAVVNGEPVLLWDESDSLIGDA